jgi:hypothetical protein
VLGRSSRDMIRLAATKIGSEVSRSPSARTIMSRIFTFSLRYTGAKCRSLLQMSSVLSMRFAMVAQAPAAGRRKVLLLDRACGSIWVSHDDVSWSDLTIRADWNLVAKRPEGALYLVHGDLSAGGGAGPGRGSARRPSASSYRDAADRKSPHSAVRSQQAAI